jgi:hypothetical protein
MDLHLNGVDIKEPGPFARVYHYRPTRSKECIAGCWNWRNFRIPGQVHSHPVQSISIIWTYLKVHNMVSYISKDMVTYLNFK